MTFSNYLPHSSILISPCVNYACVIDCHASSGLICLVKITLHWLYYLHYIQPLHVGGNSFHQPRTSEQFYNLLQAIHFPNFVSVTDWFWRWKVKGKGSKKRGGGILLRAFIWNVGDGKLLILMPYGFRKKGGNFRNSKLLSHQDRIPCCNLHTWLSQRNCKSAKMF